MKNARILTKIIFGSHLFGTSTENSDEDFKLVHLPSTKEILLGSGNKIKETATKIDKTQKNIVGDIDESSYAVSKFLKLLADGDTSAVEILLAPDEFRLETSDEFKEILSFKSKLLNRQSKGFVGYAKTQSQKYGVKGTRLSSAKAAVSFFTKLLNDYHKLIEPRLWMYEDKIYEFVSNHEHSSIEIITMPNGTEIKHINVCDRKVPFTNSLTQAIQVYSLLYRNYGERAKQAETNNGIDWKAVSHALRIAEEAVELLTTGNLIFPRPSANYLLDIKLGKINYKEVAEKIEEVLDTIEHISSNSILCEFSDINLIEDLIMKFHRSQIV